MKKENIVIAKRLPDGTIVQIMPDGSQRPLEDKTDWARVHAMTEEEAHANALSDPDNPPISDEELEKFRRVPNPREIRKKLHMTQEEFASRFALPLGTVRDWEQGARQPDTAARSYLRVIAKNPQAVLEALGG
jgi:putative transcriptional regulator